jgi:protein ImuA
MRPLAAQQEASPAVLRLLLEPGEGADALTLRLLKRRGPPLTTPLVLPARPERLQALLAASRQQSARRRQGRGPSSRRAPAAPPPASAVLAALVRTRVPAGAAPSGGPGALDRLVAPAAR